MTSFTTGKSCGAGWEPQATAGAQTASRWPRGARASLQGPAAAESGGRRFWSPRAEVTRAPRARHPRPGAAGGHGRGRGPVACCDPTRRRGLRERECERERVPPGRAAVRAPPTARPDGPRALTLVTVSNIGMRTNLMNPIWAVALVTLSLSMNGATGRPSDFSRSLCGAAADGRLEGDVPGARGTEGHCPSRGRKGGHGPHPSQPPCAGRTHGKQL